MLRYPSLLYQILNILNILQTFSTEYPPLCWSSNCSSKYIVDSHSSEFPDTLCNNSLITLLYLVFFQNILVSLANKRSWLEHFENVLMYILRTTKSPTWDFGEYHLSYFYLRYSIIIRYIHAELFHKHNF